jgi:membrane protein DedA with SNARE-associated domain
MVSKKAKETKNQSELKKQKMQNKQDRKKLRDKKRTIKKRKRVIKKTKRKEQIKKTKTKVKNTAKKAKTKVQNIAKTSAQKTKTKVKSIAKKTTNKAKKDLHKLKEKEKELRRKIIEKAIQKDTRRKLKYLSIFFIVGSGIWLFFNLLYTATGFSIIEWIKTIPLYEPIAQYIKSQIASQSAIGVFLLFAITAIFFFPTPLELIYFGIIQQDVNIKSVYLMTILGILLAQHINYLLGRFLGNVMSKLIRKKTHKRMTKTLHKYGGYGIFFFHLFPLPYALLNFIVGLSHYPYRKWLILMLPALMANYLILYLVSLLI